jgi:large subunit ribosomal protein L20
LTAETVTRAQVNARKSRKVMKREYRGLWILRVNIACRQRGLRYSEFINGCKKANIALNPKMLSEIAIADPKAIDAIFGEAKAALA